ncbi:serine/threonine-protein kinase [Streptomyces sp. A2-16]|uniref:serine/threonine-protein kinase n=1 Tax=Streptomyces sp. A2-16 TaxID=2781734 RepID=UPI002011E9DD|nr:serine/threonine-protein kinase [Streptomyces sp. A2-16]
MGRVWRAADEMLDRQVAVKEMRIDGLDAEDARTRRERTLREARATARIDHPNVVRVYDVVDEGERLWIVMELVKGRSLERMTVEDGPLAPRETALLGLGLVRALRQVHARGVLHRDIKPGNVLVESGDRTARRIVLTDFGIAAMQDAKALTMVGMLVGSPDYMAPERVSGRPQGPPSDIWSLGATLCAALGGRSPFSRDTTLATLHAVLYEEPELPASAGPLADVLAALLEKDPSIRPSLDEVESALHTVAFPTPTPTLRMGAGEDLGEGGDPGTVRGPAAVPGTAGASGTPEGSVASAVPSAGGVPEGPDDPEVAGAAGVPGATGGSDSSGAPGDGPGASPSASLDASVRPDAENPADTAGAADTPGTPPQPPGGSPEPDGSETPPDGAGKTPSPWVSGESPTPAYLGTRLVRAVRDPRLPQPEAAPEAAVEGPDVVEPSDAVPGEHGSPGAPPEPSDAVPAGHGASDTARSDDGVAAGPSEVALLGRGSSDGVRAAEPDTGPDRPRAVAEDVTAQPEPATPAEPFARPEPLEPSVGHAASASTEAVSEERSEARSEEPSGNSAGAALRAGATTTSTPLASAPTQDSLAAGAPTEHFPMPDAPTRDTPTRAASARTRVGPVPTTRRPGPGVSLVRGNQAVPERHSDAGSGEGTTGASTTGTTGPSDTGTPDSDPALVLGPHPHRMPPGELPGPARPAAPHRGRRRTALVAVGSVVAAGAVVVAIILATTSGSPGDDKAGGSSSASASVSSSAPGASTPGGTPSATVEGTSRPRSLPPGAHEEAGGFAWATPTGWRRDVKTGAEVHYTSPDGKQELAAKSSLARGDLMETWRTSEQNAHQGQDYEKIRLEETTFRDHPAVVWEYTFTLDGVPWHAELLGFNVGDKSYQINTWYQPDIEAQALRTYEKVKESFTVL